MKKFLSLSTVTLIIAFTLTFFCACGNTDNNGNIDENGTLAEDAKGILDDGDLDKNDSTNNNNAAGGKTNDSINTNDMTGTSGNDMGR